ncbi:MAG: hypothetical protein JXR95_03010 [Deltaproteobacteria bacterium]|nr:hypothetical protein [Deltaproteobacteria bacterium]
MNTTELHTRWDAMVSELKANPSVTIESAKLNPPMSEEDMNETATKLGLVLTDDLRAFLSFCDGLNLSWTSENLEGYYGGMINIPSFKTLHDPEDWLCGPDVLEYPICAYGVDFEEPEGEVIPFDFFQRNEDEMEVAFLLPREDGLDVFVSEDQTACLEYTALLTFGEYLDLVFRSFGCPLARNALQLGYSNEDSLRASDEFSGILKNKYSIDGIIELIASEPHNGQIHEFFRGE